MKTVMRARDLKKKYGFPKDIDRNKPVYVAVPFYERFQGNEYSTIIYYDKNDKIRTAIIDGLYKYFAPKIYNVDEY